MKDYTINFSWGTWTAYFSEKYLAAYDFSGRICIEQGQIIDTKKICYQPDPWGPFVKSRVYEDYGKLSFESHIRNWFDGLQVLCRGDENTIVTLQTKLGSLSIRPCELEYKKLESREVGEKYSMAVIYAETVEPWYLADFPESETILRLDRFSDLPQRDWFGVSGAAVVPTEKIVFPVCLSKPVCHEMESILPRFRLRFLVNGEQYKEKAVRGVAHFVISVNQKIVWSNSHFASFHDVDSQFLEEVFFEVPLEYMKDGANEIEIQNYDENLSVLVQLVGIQMDVRQHMQVLACPFWSKTQKPIPVTLWCNELSALVKIEYDTDLFEETVSGETLSKNPLTTPVAGLNLIGVNESSCCVLNRGENTFYFVAKKAADHAQIRFVDQWTGTCANAQIAEIWNIEPEQPEVKVGAELQTGNPYEYKERIVDIINRQIANTVVFRDYHNNSHHNGHLWEAASFCRQNGLYTDAIIMNDQAVVAKASAGHCICVGTHEHTGIFYGRDKTENKSLSMRDAASVAVAKLAAVAELFRVDGTMVAVGDASGGSRYAYMAGFDLIRHETFVGHHMLILPNARGSARAYHKKAWGVHVASQHNAQPQLDFGIRRFWLGMFLPWVMGANFIFEEDELFVSWQYNKMTGKDYLCNQKTEITKELYRYTATHPRFGEPMVDIAVIQGRYAPPISGISVANNSNEDSEGFSNENYPVWAHTGNEKWEWGYRQPEKGLHLLQVLSPGIFLTPLNQDPYKVRKFFSGNPKGEYDFLPIEANTEVIQQYKLLLFLDWHTMEQAAFDHSNCSCNDYGKLVEYVKAGGALFISLPHFTTRADREFLRDMKDLRLYNNGDLRELCGVRVLGESEECFSGPVFCGSWEQLRLVHDRGIRLPNECSEEDGKCRLAELELCSETEILIKDQKSDKPILVRYQLGSGAVYLLCTYAYPGHEELAELSYNIVLKLTDEYAGKTVPFKNANPDLYYSVWGEEGKARKLYILNTDWINSKNKKEFSFDWKNVTFSGEAQEGDLLEITLGERGILYLKQPEAYLQFAESEHNSEKYIINSPGDVVLHYQLQKNTCLECDGEELINTGCEEKSGNIRLSCCLEKPRLVVIRY